MLGTLLGHDWTFLRTTPMMYDFHRTQHPYHLSEMLDVSVYGESLEQVNHFHYLGSMISSDGSLDKEISLRLGQASGNFNSLNNIF